MGWKIVDWEKFEILGDKRSPNKFRGGLDFLQVPVKLDGDKIVELLSWKDGDRAFAVWMLLLEAWAVQDRDRRADGILWSWEDGRPATTKELSRKTHLSEPKLKTGISLLLKIGWLSAYASSTCNYGVNTTETQVITAPDLDIDIEKDLDVDIYTQRFETFWKAYPKKVDKKQAKLKFLRLAPSEELLQKMLDSIKSALDTGVWSTDRKTYIKGPAAWIENELWNNEYTRDRPDSASPGLVIPEPSKYDKIDGRVT